MRKYLIPVLSFLMLFSMVGISVLLDEKEIIFPEMAALVIGGWLSLNQPWRVGKFKMLALMTLMSVLGVVTVRYVPLPLEFKIIGMLITAAAILILNRTTFLPMISACILPIIMGTESIVYPVSVFIMAFIIILVRLLFEKQGLCKTASDTVYNGSFKLEALRWVLITAVFIPLTLAAVKFNIIFLIAPPLIVTFGELTFSQSKARKAPVKVFLCIVSCALSGAYIRFFLSVKLELPVILSTAFILIVVYIILKFLNMPFPPAGALAMLPLIIPAEKLIIYPLLVAFSSVIIILFAMLIGTLIEKLELKKESASK